MPNRATVQRPSVPAVELFEATRKDLRALAMNSKGKLTYLPALDYCFKEIYGIKHIVSRLISKKRSEVIKMSQKIQMDTLMYILLDEETHDMLRQMALLYNKIQKDAGMTSKEAKNYEKKLRKACDVIRKDFGIKKQKNADDLNIKNISAFIDRRTDDYGYFDDDDDFVYYGMYDDDDDDYYRGNRGVISEVFGSPRGHKSQTNSRLAAVVNKYEKSSKRPMDDEDDYDEYDAIKNFPQDDDDDDDELLDILRNFNDRLSGLEDSVKRRTPVPDIYPLPTEGNVQNPKPARVKNATMPATTIDLNGLSQMMSDVSRTVKQNTVSLKIFKDQTGNALDSICGAIEKIRDRVDDLDDAIYGGDEDYSDDDAIVATSGGTIAMDEVMDSFISDNPESYVEEAPAAAPSAPINVKQLDGGSGPPV